MIPNFPKFKKIELSDQIEINNFVRNQKPYSDYNFTTLWCWDIYNIREISLLNKNLLVKFTDYITNEEFYSFFGNYKIEETLKAIFNFVENQEKMTCLKLIPEENFLQHKEIAGFNIIEDIDNNDYIFSIEKLVKYNGSEYAQARNLYNRFIKRNKDITVKELDLKNMLDINQILKVNNQWQENKQLFMVEEEKALRKLISQAGNFDLMSIGVFVEGNIVAYAINEVLYNQYAISHFAQANVNFSGIYSFLMREIAISLYSKECIFLNYEQDLGLPQLRKGKKSYQPVFYFKKYSIFREF